MIVVTKFDHYYSEPEKYSQISEEEIKKGVCDSIKSATGSTTFPQQNIVPVSGRVALYARRLRQEGKLPPSPEKFVKRFLEDYADSIPAGENEGPTNGEKIPTDPLKQAEALERASGFEMLEERSVQKLWKSKDPARPEAPSAGVSTD